MQSRYCTSCDRVTGHKRALGWGTFFAVALTLGFWLFVLPFYPLRCIRCGMESPASEEKENFSDNWKTVNPADEAKDFMQPATYLSWFFVSFLISVPVSFIFFLGENKGKAYFPEVSFLEALLLGILFALFFSVIFKGERISIPFRNEQEFLAGLHTQLKKLQYRPEYKIADVFTYTHPSPLSLRILLPLGRISVRIDDNSAIIVGPKLILKKLMPLKTGISREQGESHSSLDPKLDMEARLQQMKNLFEKGLISEEEYQSKRMEALKEL